MEKGIVYLMTTVVDGIIKEGSTETNNFEERMRTLERNGYWNVGGLKRYFAVEVDDYKGVEKHLQKIYSKSQVSTSELFALDINLAKETLMRYGGKQVYPKIEESIANKISTKIEKITPTHTPQVFHTNEAKHPHKAAFRFSLLNIPVGSELQYVGDSSITCTVKDDRRVVFNGKTYYLSRLAYELRWEQDKDKRNFDDYRGTEYFKYNGELISTIYDRIIPPFKKSVV